MPKVSEFYLFYKTIERRDTLTLGTLDHFRHFEFVYKIPNL